MDQSAVGDPSARSSCVRSEASGAGCELLLLLLLLLLLMAVGPVAVVLLLVVVLVAVLLLAVVLLAAGAGSPPPCPRRHHQRTGADVDVPKCEVPDRPLLPAGRDHHVVRPVPAAHKNAQAFTHESLFVGVSRVFLARTSGRGSCSGRRSTSRRAAPPTLHSRGPAGDAGSFVTSS